jgi:hypothetical protein
MPAIGQRIRFAIQYAGARRPLGWVRAGSDGSIYVGALLGKPNIAKNVDKPAEKETRIEYGQLKQLDNLPKSSRLSFHPSGEVHIGDKVVRGLVSLEKLERSLQLCTLMFAHPGRYRPPDDKAHGDFDLGIVGYEVDEGKPMYGAIMVTPWTANVQLPANLDNMTQFVGAAVGLRGFTRTPDLLISIILGHGPSGPWPELPGIAVVYQGGPSRDRSADRCLVRVAAGASRFPAPE